MRTTKVFSRNLESRRRFVINQGGARSSKTISLCQLMIYKLLTEKNIIITICRKAFPSLRGSVMRDFVELLQQYGLYDEANHNRTSNEYVHGSNLVEFISIDDAQKVRGRKRTYCWLNEGNELSYEDFVQLNMRTTKQMYIDFNPSDQFCFIYDIMTNFSTECDVIKSTFRDNPFLPRSIVQQIENFKNTDENYWLIYGLGERGSSKYNIYTRWSEYEELPKTEDFCYGLDFGFNHPTALVRVHFNERSVYWEEVLYMSGLTTNDLISKLAEINVEKHKEMWCDAADPKTIEELKRNGYNAISADKSVKAGIDLCKSLEINVHKDSINLKKELRTYKWKQQGDRTLDEPVKINDDGMDAARYATYNYWQNTKMASGDWMIL